MCGSFFVLTFPDFIEEIHIHSIASNPASLPSSNRPDIHDPRNTPSSRLGTRDPQSRFSHQPGSPCLQNTTYPHYLWPDTHDLPRTLTNPPDTHDPPHRPSHRPDTPFRSNRPSAHTAPLRPPAPQQKPVKFVS